MQQVHSIPRLLAGMTLGLSLLVLAQPAAGQGCSGPSPAFGVDNSLWGSLQPTDIGQLPDLRDSTNYTGLTRPDFRYPLYSWIDVEGDHAFTTYSSGLSIWDIGGATNARDPERVGTRDGWQNGFISWPPGNSETRELVFGIDLPNGNSNVAAVVGISPVGVSVWNTTAKNNPLEIYADKGRSSYQVYAATIGGRSYAFAAAEQTGIGVHVYDMTAALALPSSCVEDSTIQTACPGVYKGRIGNPQSVSYIHGFKTGNRDFIAFTSGVPVRGVEIWEVTNPQSPANVKPGGGRYLSSSILYGVATFEQAGKQYLAVIRDQGSKNALIYDISSCLSGGCSGDTPGTLKWTSPNLRGSSTRWFVTHSKSGATPYLYLGLEDMCSNGPQREYLYDVTNPASPVQRGVEAGVTNWPNPGGAIDPYPVDYWTWYYAKSPTGFSQVQPRAAKFNDNYLYRAGWTIFDVHQLGTVSPSVSVSGPATGYAGDPIQFTASASNCTPSPTGWTWTTGGGTGASTTSSISITWSTPGPKTVTASNSACGAALGQATINVADPAPAIGSVTASPTSAPVCTPITFTANNVTGRPPLSFAWTVEQSGTPLPGVSGSSNPFTWDTTGALPGTYQGVVTVSGTGAPATDQATVTLTALPPLPSPGFAISNDPFTAGTVQFHSNAAGATRWVWNFGDGTVLDTTDPVLGPDPSHDYATIGDYTVFLEVNNCQNPTLVRSADLPISIIQINPLVINNFALSNIGCFPGFGCNVSTGESLTFNQSFSGDPNFYDYDWNGDGTYEDASNAAPVTNHTYTSTGGPFHPKMRIRRGSEFVEFTHVEAITVSSGGPPPTPTISISGPSSTTVGASVTLTASASNCSPTANGWTWTTSGGTGSSTSNQITVSWSTTGAKSVRATNSHASCSGAQGLKTVSVTSGGGGGGGGGGGNLVPNFTFSPLNPQAGQSVTFDASGSTGNIGSYAWNFGDGGVAVGASVSHVFDDSGTYPVRLNISEPGCGFSPCETAEATRDVVVGGGSTGACTADADTLCLLDGRFKVEVHFRNQHAGDEEGDGQRMDFPATNQSGAFWFFNPTTVELLVKMVDATTLPTPAYWVFYGSLTDVEFWLTVTDTKDTVPTSDDESVEYHNLPGSVCGQGDTSAFLVPTGGTGGGGDVTGGVAPLLFARLGDDELAAAGAGLAPVTGPASGTCVPSDAHLCLLDGRFQVEVDYYDQHNDESGVGTAVDGTDQTGYFWFFNADNLELVLKMIDASQIPEFGYFWVFWGGLSDVEYHITVTDTVSQETWERTNAPGNICGGFDLQAFEP